MSTDCSGFSAGTAERLLNDYDRLDLPELLELEEPWTVRDCGRDQIEMAGLLNKLQAIGAVEVVGELPVKWPGQTQWHTINRYRFDPRAREVIEEYREDRNELPCGHRAHIHHRADGEFGCRFCDEDVSFEREVVEGSLK